MIRDFDAIVIGGGPAGAIAALHLAQMGWDVALIEKGARHRNKCCGHCLNPQAFAPLRRAGIFDSVRAIARGATNIFRVNAPNQESQSARLSPDPNSPGGLIVERSQFDQLLIDHARRAGAVVFQPAAARVHCGAARQSIVQVRTAGDRVELRSSLVIGADGLGSGVARSAGLAHDAASGRKYGFSFDIERTPDDDVHHGEIEMFVSEGGYLGLVRPSPNRLHVAALVADICGAGTGRDPFAFVNAIAARHPALARLCFDRLQRGDVGAFAAIGPMPWRPREMANERAALIGDAAGYIEPFTGEGMSWALHSAEALAEAVNSVSPGCWNERLASEYRLRWRERMSRQHWRCRVIALGVSQVRMTQLALRAARLLPAVKQHIVNRLVAA
jgi:flavin-dependent dehydrogenase